MQEGRSTAAPRRGRYPVVGILGRWQSRGYSASPGLGGSPHPLPCHVQPPEAEPAPGCSPLEGKGAAEEPTNKRQAFIVVYSVKDEASFREASTLTPP